MDILNSKKYTDGEDSENKSDLIINMINGFEKKIMQKIGFIDERTKKSEADIYGLKNEITNLKNGLDQTNKNVGNLKEQTETIFLRLEDVKANIKSANDLTNNALTELLNKVKSSLDDQISE
jgi:methyl-accepting chemotaxis protein